MRLCALPILALTVLGQDSPTFKTGVSLVHMDAEVVAADGRILTGFVKDDFRILDDGKEQPILHFSAGEDPLDLILLFDISGSMRPKTEEVAAAAGDAVQELRPGDRVAIMAFNSRSSVVLPFTDDLDRVQRSIREDILGLRFGGGTLIQRAVSDAAARFRGESRTQRRRAVLIVTDDFGIRTKSDATVIRELWEADALLTALIVRAGKAVAAQTINTVFNPTMLALRSGVRGIAENTGGDYLRAENAGRDFQESMRRIRSRYSIYYATPQAKPGARRTIRVELANTTAKANPKTKIRARTGYVTPAETAH
jgi:VWFA-related protein